MEEKRGWYFTMATLFIRSGGGEGERGAQNGRMVVGGEMCGLAAGPGIQTEGWGRSGWANPIARASQGPSMLWAQEGSQYAGGISGAGWGGG
jgi:hypothetical protein